MANYSSILAWKIPWTKVPGRHGVAKNWGLMPDPLVLGAKSI